MTDFKKLIVWQRGRQLVRAVYAATKAFPEPEIDGLTSQIQRAAVSIPTNIAEGCARQSDREQARFFRIALASARELESLLVVSNDLEFLRSPEYEALISETGQLQAMLVALIRHRTRAAGAQAVRKRSVKPA